MIEKHLQPMINDIIEHTKQNYNDRKIIIWGNYILSEQISEELKNKLGLNTEFFVDSNESKQNCWDTFSPEKLDGKSSEYYVIIPVAFYQSLKNHLEKYGYNSKEDYYYFSDCIVKHDDFYYEDSHGNKIIGWHKGLHFAFSGFNSIITIGERVTFDDTSVYMHNNSKIKIGERTTFDDTSVYINNDSEIKIGDETKLQNVIFGGGGNNVLLQVGNSSKLVSIDISSHDNSTISIGKNFSTCGDDLISAYKDIDIIIGDDCMFSFGIYLFSNDGHTIFNVNTHKNINSTDTINQKRKIKIGNHVWIGARTTILYNTEIGDGSIIGANSLVKSKIPNNCIASGVPAKVIKKNISWCRNNCSENIIECGEEYISITKE